MSTKVELTICLHSRCSISENKMAALPTGSSGLLNSLQKQNKSPLDAKLNPDSCSLCGAGMTATTVHCQTVKAPEVRKPNTMRHLGCFYLFILFIFIILCFNLLEIPVSNHNPNNKKGHADCKNANISDCAKFFGYSPLFTNIFLSTKVVCVWTVLNQTFT